MLYQSTLDLRDWWYTENVLNRRRMRKRRLGPWKSWKKSDERRGCIDLSTYLAEVSNLGQYSRMYRQAYPVSCTCIHEITTTSATTV